MLRYILSKYMLSVVKKMFKKLLIKLPILSNIVQNWSDMSGNGIPTSTLESSTAPQRESSLSTDNTFFTKINDHVCSIIGINKSILFQYLLFIFQGAFIDIHF
ncbi:MAG: hypothetical protein U9Q66_03370 [Patescibacteria group bacterium]|nr:hypothetical protein [Patescibacteria group bacterium]